MKALTYALALLAALRAIRFITTDHLGEWAIVGPAKEWAWKHDAPAGTVFFPDAPRPDPMPTPEAYWGWRSKLVSGLDCPFCVGFWITGGLVLLAALVSGSPRPRKAFNVLAGAVGANYIVGHVSAHLDG